MILFLTGAIVMASAVIALFFLRFWRSTGQRFFLYFSLSFFVEALHRAYSAWDGASHEDSPYHYLIRLLSYGLILWAVVEKNLRPRSPDS
ncbi:DUF5985 family protein [Duganella radicis]|uniref:Uncharacterized protein n=1 Tax=Duganella radicis TaxID=551988 RepID=A0A6L6PIJ8_9BURK|nr:DUF5985 family protein [Duganella radicis]MTV38371.1 hypothetical protein [Duganella radicis]